MTSDAAHPIEPAQPGRAWIAPAVFAVLTLAMFAGVLINPHKLLSSTDTDIVLQFLPWRAYGFGQIAKGNFPLWNPHVFGGESYAGADHLTRWEQLKRGESEEPASAIAGVPRSLPALFMTERLLERAERVKVHPPLEEGDGVGERLFALVADARREGVDAEQALRAVNRRFADRFERLEALARLNGRELETLTDQELADLWKQAR